MSGKRTVYIHAGTHKTGTTSIQTFAMLNEPTLAAKGVFIPRSGRAIIQLGSVNVGHHNLAWELNDIPMFQANDGTFDQVIAEVERSSAPSVLLSSEDFEWLHAKPGVLKAVRDRFEAIGYETKVVLYLRAQAEYMQSIYVEGSKSGMLINFAAYRDEILDTGTYVPDPRVINRFEYGPLLDGFAEAFGRDNLIVRAYEARAPEVRLLEEFLGLIDPEPWPMAAMIKPQRLNVSPSMLEVLHGMYGAVRARDASAPDPGALVREHFPGIDARVFLEKFDATPEDEVRSALERFGEGNRRIHERYGARIPFESPADLRPRDAAAWERVRLQRALLDAAIVRWGI